MIPGEYFLAGTPIQANVGREVTSVAVSNTGDRPVQVGSHFHFFEVNKQMSFDRAKAFGFRLNIPAGTAVRFEPGEEKVVELVALGGSRKVYGFSNLVDGDSTTEAARNAALQKAADLHFKNNPA